MAELNDKAILTSILDIIGVEDDWYSNEEIAELLIAHSVKYVPPKLKGGE